MHSARLQRSIDVILDQAEAAVARRDWGGVSDAARRVLALDETNEDALGFLRLAEPPVLAPAPVTASRLRGGFAVFGARQMPRFGVPPGRGSLVLTAGIVAAAIALTFLGMNRVQPVLAARAPEPVAAHAATPTAAPAVAVSTPAPAVEAPTLVAPIAVATVAPAVAASTPIASPPVASAPAPVSAPAPALVPAPVAASVPAAIEPPAVIEPIASGAPAVAPLPEAPLPPVIIAPLPSASRQYRGDFWGTLGRVVAANGCEWDTPFQATINATLTRAADGTTSGVGTSAVALSYVVTHTPVGATCLASAVTNDATGSISGDDGRISGSLTGPKNLVVSFIGTPGADMVNGQVTLQRNLSTLSTYGGASANNVSVSTGLVLVGA